MENARIVIVEDDVIISSELKNSLETLHYTVVAMAQTGKEAIAEAEKHRPDLILMDIMLDGEMDGIEAAKAIHATCNIPIVYLTATSSDDVLERAKLTLPQGYLIKPVQSSELKATLEMVLYTAKIDSERKAAEEALRINEKKYRVLAENLPDYISRHDREGRCVFASSRYSELSGKPVSECLGKTYAEIGFPPHQAAELQGLIEKLFTTGEPQETDYFCEGESGTRYLNCRLLPEYDREGSIEYALGITRDLTEREQAKFDLQHQMEFLFNVINSFSHPFYVIDVDNHEVVLANEASQIGDITSEPVKCYSLFHQSTKPCFENKLDCPMEKVMRTQKPATSELTYTNAIGTKTVEINAHPVFDAEGKISRIIEYHVDITQRKRAKTDLIESKKRYYDLYDNAPDMFASVDARTARVIECNQTLAQVTGFAKQEIIGQPVFHLYTPESAKYAEANLFPAFSKTGLIDKEELQLQCQDGAIIDVSLNASAVRDSSGEILYSRSIWRDITEKKRMEHDRMELERHLQQNQKMEALGTLASGIAHDFNNILYPILGYASLGLVSTPSDDKLHTYFNSILNSSKRAQDLAKQIVTFTRCPKQEMKPLKLQPVVKEVMQILRASFPATIDIQQDIDQNCGMVMADLTQIHQIILHIATNAYQAMEETGGELKVGLKSTNGYEDSGTFVVLSISDTGEGMGPEVQQKIFDPYFTTKKKSGGTGLGLSAVLGIVKNHQGFIKVSSTVGQGTRFDVYLPQLTETSSEIGDLEIISESGSGRILLIDDEISIIETATAMLEKLGYEIISKTSGVEALEVFQSHPDKFDLIITDMAMPGMTGEHLACSVLEIRPDFPIILCSGHSERIDQQKAKSLGIKEFLMKPLTFQQMANAVGRLLN